MKRLLIFITLLAVFAGSCSFLEFGQNPADIDTQATIDAIVRESAEETLAAQPSPTTVPPTQASTQVVAVSSPTFTATMTATALSSSSTPKTSSTSAPNLTTTPVTATSGPGENPTATKAVAGSLTVTPTPGILLYGTLPPAVPSARITIVNKSRAQVYISLQNRPPDGPAAFLEYPVRNQVKVDAPLGYYVYVVWVGGRKIVGEFTLHKDDDITITIFKDKVKVH